MSIPAECFVLTPGAGTLQTRIRQMVAEGILSGRLRPGERMPSSRALAAHLGVSRITVTLAYAELVADEFLTARGRSGYRVAQRAPLPRLPEAGGLSAARGEGVDWARLLAHRRPSGPISMGKPPDWRSYRYPFVYGQADPTLFDHASWRLCVLQSMGQRDFPRMADDLFERDDPGLLDYTARHTLPRRGILAREDEVLITLGAQNALWLAAQLLLNRRRTAAIEEPGYPALRDILGQIGCRVRAAPVGPQGLDPAQLPQGLDALFCTPSHQCPTGATMPLDARQRLIDRAGAERFVIVEDDYEFEITHDRAPLPALKSLDRDGRVIHVGSFSKSLFPGLRLGFLVGPAPFIAAARALRATLLRHPPGLLQRAAAQFLSLGHYDAMLRRLTQTFARRREAMLRAIAAEGLEIAGQAGSGGSSLWMRAPEGVAAVELAAALHAESVLIEPGHPFFGTAEARDRHYRIAYSSITEDRIAPGIARIAARIRALRP
jgi:GntR family transcriptional regulator/MocR family aminotransferase